MAPGKTGRRKICQTSRPPVYLTSQSARMIVKAIQTQIVLRKDQRRKPGISLKGKAPDLISFKTLINSLMTTILSLSISLFV